MQPFITFYTPTYKRPQALARCLASVASQTVVGEIEQIVIPDHVGVGIHGMYARVPQYASAVHGEYVMFLCDDDVLADATVVETVKTFARSHDNPPLILVATKKGPNIFPAGNPWPPQCGSIDLNCAIVRWDVWTRHAGSYGARYEGDWDFMQALHLDGVAPLWCDVILSHGAVSRGRAEAA
jgi:hypothetical protein